MVGEKFYPKLMEIPDGILERYVGYITSSLLVAEEGVPEDVSEYLSDVILIRKGALANEHLDALEVSLRYLLSTGALDESLRSRMSGPFYDFDKDEMFEILKYIYSQIWCDGREPHFDEVPNIKLVKVSCVELENWKQKNRGRARQEKR